MNGSLLYRIVQFLQGFPFTSWLWQFWQHDETGRITMLPIWKHPGRRWSRCKWRE